MKLENKRRKKKKNENENLMTSHFSSLLPPLDINDTIMKYGVNNGGNLRQLVINVNLYHVYERGYCGELRV